MAKIELESPIKKKVFQLALANIRIRSSLLEKGERPGYFTEAKHVLFDKLVFSKIRDRFGGRLR